MLTPARPAMRSIRAPASPCSANSPVAAAILAIADADQPPLRIFLGDQQLPLMRTEYANRITEWEAWDEMSRKAFG